MHPGVIEQIEYSKYDDIRSWCVDDVLDVKYINILCARDVIKPTNQAPLEADRFEPRDLCLSVCLYVCLCACSSAAIAARLPPLFHVGDVTTTANAR